MSESAQQVCEKYFDRLIRWGYSLSYAAHEAHVSLPWAKARVKGLK